MRLQLDAVVVPTLKAFENRRKAKGRSTPSSSKRKRSSDEGESDADNSDTRERSTKRRGTSTASQSPAEGFWSPPVEFVEIEGPELVLPGETPEDDDEVDVSRARVDEMTVRMLRNFTFFDTGDDNRMVPLDAIEEEGTAIEGAGFVTPLFENEEEEGDDDDDEFERRYVRLGAIFRFWLDYTSENSAVWVQTQCSWYILEGSSKEYSGIHEKFMKPHRITQSILSSATRDSREDYQNFLRRSEFGYGWSEGDLLNSVSTVQHALDHLDTRDPIPTSQVLKKLLPTRKLKKFTQSQPKSPQLTREGTSDLDASKRVNPTHVTPLIASLAGGLVREALQVVGPKPSSKLQLDRYQQDALPRLLERVRDEDKGIELLEADARDGDHGVFYSQVKVGSTRYKVGDVVLTLRDGERFLEPHHIFADHFWFGRIIFIDGNRETAHLHYLNHGSHFDLGELADPYELFIDYTCAEIPLNQLAGKVDVEFIPHQEIPPTIPSNKFYVRYCTEPKDKAAITRPSITALTHERYDFMKLLSSMPPPDNCPICIYGNQQAESQDVKVINSGQSIAHGGYTYHLYDLVLYTSSAGPANIGQLAEIHTSKAAVCYLTVVQFGRIRDAKGAPPDRIIDSERQLFMTPQTERIRPVDIVRPCHLFPFGTLPDGQLEDWLDVSPYHFFVKFSFPVRDSPSWRERSPLGDFRTCHQCVNANFKVFEKHRDFLAHCRRTKLSALDLFGGCGALGLGLANGSQSLEVTHAIEILPSSAKTYERNSRNTKVYNQCVNTMLKYAIKEHSGHSPERPKQLWDGETDVPPPPRPGDVQVIVAGFPCQTFSHLNRFKQEGSVKSNLILNALSWVDFLKPKYCLFENVPAFKDERLCTPQVQRTDGIRGEVQSGYFKLLLRTLLEMGYQIRHGVLQAGEYGTPQSRQRFFLIAAKGDLALPQLPQPTHFFPTHRHPSIPYRLPHHSVTIDDAINDLQPFDWRDPDLPTGIDRGPGEQDRVNIPVFECIGSRCGFDGQVDYVCPPRTRFQKQVRRKPTSDIQHFTKVLKKEHVRRTLGISMDPFGDYRSLKASMGCYETSNPCSSMGRKGYLPGLFGRLSGQHHFPTTVTNLGPTAKQCRVIHPYCKRMVSVREYARSQGFPDHIVLVALDGRVVTMHREIGNAVPFPLSMAIGAEFRKVLQESWAQNYIEIDLDDNEDD